MSICSLLPIFSVFIISISLPLDRQVYKAIPLPVIIRQSKRSSIIGLPYQFEGPKFFRQLSSNPIIIMPVSIILVFLIMDRQLLKEESKQDKKSGNSWHVPVFASGAFFVHFSV